MKVALCFSGQPRFVDRCYPLIKDHLLNLNDVDVFVHTWFSDEIVGKKLYSESISSFSGDSKIDKDTIIKIKDLYTPIKIIVDKPKYFYSDLNWGKTISKYFGNGDPNLSPDDFRKIKVSNMYSFLYSNMKSILLKKEHELENNFTYDCVVRFRFDNILRSPIIFKNFDMEYLHYQEMSQPDNMISDWINFSSSFKMDIYSTIFQNFEKLSEISLKKYDAFSPESLIRDICNKNDIKCKGGNFNIELPKHGKINL